MRGFINGAWLPPGRALSESLMADAEGPVDARGIGDRSGGHVAGARRAPWRGFRGELSSTSPSEKAGVRNRREPGEESCRAPCRRRTVFRRAR